MSIVTTSSKIWRRSNKLSSLIGTKGTISSFTIIRVAPKGFVHYTPFPVVIVEASNGKKLIGQLTDYSEEDIVIGRKVIAVIRRMNTEHEKEVIPYVIKFRPL